MRTLPEIVCPMVALVGQSLNPDRLENHPKLVCHVCHMTRLVGGVLSEEIEAEFRSHQLLGHRDLLLHVGLELKDEVYLVLGIESALDFIKNSLQVPEGFHLPCCDHQDFVLVVVKLEEPQEVGVIDSQDMPLSTHAVDVSDDVLGTCGWLGEDHRLNAQLILDAICAPEESL